MTTCEQPRPGGLVVDAARPRAAAGLGTGSGSSSVDLSTLIACDAGDVFDPVAGPTRRA